MYLDTCLDMRVKSDREAPDTIYSATVLSGWARSEKRILYVSEGSEISVV